MQKIICFLIFLFVVLHMFNSKPNIMKKEFKKGDRVNVTAIIKESWMSNSGIENALVISFDYEKIHIKCDSFSRPIQFSRALNSGVYYLSSYNVEHSKKITMKPKPQETFYDSDLQTAYLKINGYLVATLKNGIFELFEEVSQEDENYYISLLEDEVKSHNYHAKNMSTNYN